MDINTPKGMADAVQWLNDMISACQTETFVWGIPRSMSIYTIHLKTKTYSRFRQDLATDKVLAAAGYYHDQGRDYGLKPAELEQAYRQLSYHPRFTKEAWLTDNTDLTYWVWVYAQLQEERQMQESSPYFNTWNQDNAK